jgi:hypothetical protein
MKKQSLSPASPVPLPSLQGDSLKLLDEKVMEELVPWKAVLQMLESGVFDKRRNVLEMGHSKLGPIPASELSPWLLRLQGKKSLSEVDQQALKKLIASSESSDFDQSPSVGELLKLAGMTYRSLAQAGGANSPTFSLERDSLPSSEVGAWDVVLNLGTSSRLMNQLHFTQLMHQAARKRGVIVHWLPAISGGRHYWLSSTGRLLFDIGYFNQYELIAFSMERGEDLEAIDLPVFEKKGAGPAKVSSNLLIQNLRIPRISMLAACLKTQNEPFLGAVELQTSVGEIPAEVASSYGPKGMARTGRAYSKGAIPKLLRKLRSLPILSGILNKVANRK